MRAKEKAKRLRFFVSMLNRVLGRDLLGKAIAAMPQEQRVSLLFSNRPFVEMAKLVLGDRLDAYLRAESEEESIDVALDSIINFVKSLDFLLECDEIEDIIRSISYEDINHKDKFNLFYEMNCAVLGLYNNIKAGSSIQEEKDKDIENIKLFSSIINKKIDDQC